MGKILILLKLFLGKLFLKTRNFKFTLCLIFLQPYFLFVPKTDRKLVFMEKSLEPWACILT